MANIFPRWTNLLPLKIAICVGALATSVVLGVSYFATPKTLAVGYQPAQPIPFDHSLHVEQLGMDCRYCHSFVEVSGHSNVPSANTCWNCHQHVKRDSPRLEPLRRAIDVSYPLYDGKPIEWVKVHKVPDYAYFNHSAHVNRGISCQSCHGNINEMRVVYQAENLSMGWCLDCHRAPEKHLRPLEQVFNLNYDVIDYLNSNEILDAEGKRIRTQKELGLKLKEQWNIHPKESCTTCHH